MKGMGVSAIESVVFRLKLVKCDMCKNATIKDREICSVETQESVSCEVVRSDKNYLQAKVASHRRATNAQTGQGPPKD